MRNWMLFCLAACGLVALQIPSVRAQMTEEEKKRLFLRAREDIRPVPRPQASPTPRPKPKTVSSPTPRPTPKPTPKATPEATPKAPPDNAPRATPPPGDASDNILEPGRPDPDRPKPSPTPDAPPEPRTSPAPRSTATPAPTPSGKTPDGNRLDAPIVIEKSGLEADQGYEPPPKNVGGWFKRWKYLSPSVRRAIDQAKVKKGRWKYIIVHNSGTRQGNARIFDTYHRRTRKMQNGLAYHFVIGNGSSSGDGEIEIGPRWTKQINGGHVASDYLNNIAIGVCFVGDFNRDRPTAAQMGALDELVQYLRGRVGKVKGKPAIVVPHKKINPKPTDCPGDRFPYKWMRDKYG
jgi:hypothetical protein